MAPVSSEEGGCLPYTERVWRLQACRPSLLLGAVNSQASHEHAHAYVPSSRGITDWATHRSDLCITSCRNSVGESYMTSLIDWPASVIRPRPASAAGECRGTVP